MHLCRSAVLVSTLFLGVAGWTQGPPVPGHDQQRRAVDAIRIVNTAELQYFNTVGHYGSLDDIRKSGAISQAHSMFPEGPDILNLGEPLPGFTVRLITSEDRKRYQL